MICRCLLSLLLLTSLVGILQADPFPLEAVKPLVPSPDETRAIIILREWSEAHQNCTTVQGKFLRIWYDDVFKAQKHAAGEFSYLGPRRGFWKFGSPAKRPKAEWLKQSERGEPYKYEYAEPEAWYWLTDRLLRIDEAEKTVEFYRLPPGIEKTTLLGFGDFFKTVDSLLPLMPGNPNQKYLDQLTRNSYFKVLKENQTHIWIAGKPKKLRQVAMYQEFKLYLEKSPWRLKAIQLIHPGGNQSSVYIFSEVNFDPQEWDEPDLIGYKRQNDLPEAPVEWPVEARYPETTERGPVEVRRPQQPGLAWFDFLNPTYTIGFALWELVH
ncbi:hypothetical protein Enr10x_31640 [Gimesia panareensis]|uniref:GWxTD domain-containing protein n=1 Tax=Gimesia panareensis TaxID=2527978 RepID=A0A517Q878_9PLAN|nr:hypothetical protein [Gimesia panareensis]QDT27830.1 hypothetical protein Enr10x_31640 [Gimesia panareensis]